MNTIINPNTGERYSLWSKQGKRLLKSFVNTFQNGGNWEKIKKLNKNDETICREHEEDISERSKD